MTDQESLHNRLEREIAELLLNKLEHLEITPKRASQIARFVLNTLPDGMTNKDTQRLLPELDDEFFELSEIVYKHMSEYEEKYKSLVLDEASSLVKHGRLEEASDLMRKYFEEKIPREKGVM